MLTYKNPKAKSCVVCERVFVPGRDDEAVCCAVCALKRAREEARNVLTIELPWPDSKLNPNRSKGAHWASTSALRKKARNDAFWLTRGALLQRLMATGTQFNSGGALPLVITFVQPDKRTRDRDNLLAALKPSLDGIADSLGCNDAQFDPITICREYGAKPGCVRVEVGC